MIIVKLPEDRDDYTALRQNNSQKKGENRVQYVTSGSVAAQPTPPHLPQTTYQSG